MKQGQRILVAALHDFHDHRIFEDPTQCLQAFHARLGSLTEYQRIEHIHYRVLCDEIIAAYLNQFNLPVLREIPLEIHADKPILFDHRNSCFDFS